MRSTAIERGAHLAGLGVLIPRPERNPDKLSEMLNARGCDVYCMPVIDILPAPAMSSTDEWLPALRRADVVIFISANAARYCLDAVAETGLGMPEAATFFAVGRSTAEVLTSRGFRVTYPPEHASSDGLLELPAMADVSGKKIVICRGEGGREKLCTELRNRGAEVMYVDLYRRVPSARYQDEINALICADSIQVVVIHSEEILRAFLRCLDSTSLAKIANLTMVAPGERVADLLRNEGLERVIEATSALPEKIVATLVRWYTAR